MGELFWRVRAFRRHGFRASILRGMRGIRKSLSKMGGAVEVWLLRPGAFLRATPPAQNAGKKSENRQQRNPGEPKTARPSERPRTGPCKLRGILGGDIRGVEAYSVFPPFLRSAFFLISRGPVRTPAPRYRTLNAAERKETQKSVEKREKCGKV